MLDADLKKKKKKYFPGGPDALRHDAPKEIEGEKPREAKERENRPEKHFIGNEAASDQKVIQIARWKKKVRIPIMLELHAFYKKEGIIEKLIIHGFLKKTFLKKALNARGFQTQMENPVDRR